MGKASTNAGIHPYLRPEFKFNITTNETAGIPFSKEPVYFMDSIVKTEYKDKNKKDLYFKDKVDFDNVTYEIDYDNVAHRWILKDGKNIVALKDAYKKSILVLKCPARQKL